MEYREIDRRFRTGLEFRLMDAESGDPEALRDIAPMLDAIRYAELIEEMDDDELTDTDKD